MAESSDRREDPDERPRPAAAPYRVLARKYRPATFEDLIGQDAMVRTLSNAFETGRVPQAWILTGVRGVGKTTTARILARALNYQRPDGSGGPTVIMPGLGVHCQAIMESRHVDVLEMDAASHNGVDDVRQINEAVRYAPVTARYKVYILDEVHMLSGAAFNALLKTLEEPPPHAKFVFATTEIRKVPVTVLSRCQRFDLRRVEAGVLVRHLSAIAAKEGVAVEADALALIARAADGSVRDALSLLDQAMAHAGPECAAGLRATDVRQMLGLADRARVIDLFEAVMRGDVATALQELRDQYDGGADPVVVLADLAEFTHVVTRLKIVPEGPGDPAIGESEHTRGRALAAALPMRVLSRAWQMLLRGIAEVQTAGKPIAAAEMVLVRIAYAADLPTPEEVIRSLGSTERPLVEASSATSGASEVATPLAVAPRLDAVRVEAPRAAASLARALSPPLPNAANAPSTPMAPNVPPMARFEDVIALAAARRDLVIKSALERDVRLVRIEEGTLEIALENGASKTLANDLARKLGEWTGRRWMVIVSAEAGAPTVRSQIEADRRELLRGVHADPLVQAVLARFPGAEILDVRRRAPEPVDEGGLSPEVADDDQDDDGAGITDASAL
jgi:DNA polymerase III subunit gamma/tau